MPISLPQPIRSGPLERIVMRRLLIVRRRIVVVHGFRPLGNLPSICAGRGEAGDSIACELDHAPASRKREVQDIDVGCIAAYLPVANDVNAVGILTLKVGPSHSFALTRRCASLRWYDNGCGTSGSEMSLDCVKDRSWQRRSERATGHESKCERRRLSKHWSPHNA